MGTMTTNTDGIRAGLLLALTLAGLGASDHISWVSWILRDASGPGQHKESCLGQACGRPPQSLWSLGVSAEICLSGLSL